MYWVDGRKHSQIGTAVFFKKSAWKSKQQFTLLSDSACVERLAMQDCQFTGLDKC